MRSPVAAIDVGSNSVRLAVIRTDCQGVLQVIEEAQGTPRLIRDVSTSGVLTERSIEKVVGLLREFQLVASGAEASPLVAVATSAVRDAGNGEEFLERVRVTTGIDLRVIEGGEEARLACLGAIHSLPAEDGIVLDIGGGSLEIVQFADRVPVQTWTFPLGALRLNDRFLKSDPPTKGEMEDLRLHVRQQLREARLPRLAPGGRLVGTGGTIRALAKVDRARREYPLTRLHGYALTESHLGEVGELLSSQAFEDRLAVEGLNGSRADTIVAGALIVEVALDELDAGEILLSGHGLREGIALNECGSALPSVEQVRRAAVHELQRTFLGDTERADRRTLILGSLLRHVHLAQPEVETALEVASRLLDVGRSVDYYNRHRHAEYLILTHGLAGFSHREHAMVCTLIRGAETEKYRQAYAPILDRGDERALMQGAALLAAADELERRLPEAAVPGLDYEREGDELVVRADIPADWEPDSLTNRLLKALDLRLTVKAGAAG